MQVNASHSLCGLRVYLVICVFQLRRESTQYAAVPNQANGNTALSLSLVLSGLLTGCPLCWKNWRLLFLEPSGFLDLLWFQGRGFRAILIEADVLLHRIY